MASLFDFDCLIEMLSSSCRPLRYMKSYSVTLPQTNWYGGVFETALFRKPGEDQFFVAKSLVDSL